MSLNGQEFILKLKKQYREALDEVAKESEIVLKESVSGSSPSAPYDPPGMVTGDLMRACKVFVISDLDLDCECSISYAEAVEFGHRARDGSSVAPRPFLRPHRSWMKTHFKSMLLKALNQ
jgi:hypothetical protein